MTKRTVGALSILCLLASGAVVPGVSTAQEPCTWEIGFMGALSGDFSYYGRPIRNAIELALDQANDVGDLACTLDLNEMDSQGDPNQAPPLADALVDDERVVACLCGVFSGETLATGEIFEDGNLLMASTGTNPVNARQGFRTWFRTVANDKDEARALARYLRHRWAPRRVVLVHDRQDYSVGTMRALRRTLDWRVEAVMRIQPEESDYSRTAERINEVNADLVVYSGYAPQAAPMLLQLRRSGANIPFATTGASVGDPQFTKLIKRNWGDRPIRAFAACTCSDPRRIPAASEFVDAYRARYGRPPRIYAGDNYDVANFVIDLLRTRGATDEVPDIRAAMVDHFNGLTREPGIIKPYTWLNNGELHAGGRHTFIYKWRNDDWRMLGSVFGLIR
jgi:branched-chain amino acid transport system substrate-binding protein